MFLTFSAVKERLEDCGQLAISNGTVKSYSETIEITADGPSRDCVYGSTLEWFGERNFKETVICETRMFPYLYCTTLVVPGPPPVGNQDDGDEVENGSQEHNGTDDHDDDDAHTPTTETKNYVTYLETIGLKPKWVPVHYEESTYTYPKETKTTYVTTFTFDPNASRCKFVVGVEIWAAANVADLGPLVKVTSDNAEVEDGSAEVATSTHLLNCHSKKELGLNDVVCHPVVLDFNCNVYNTAKEILNDGIQSEPHFFDG